MSDNDEIIKEETIVEEQVTDVPETLTHRSSPESNLDEIYQKILVVVDESVSRTVKNQLGSLEQLTRLEFLKDENTVESIAKLLELKPTPRQILIGQIIKAFFDFLKFFAVCALVIFSLNFETGRNVVKNTLSVIGFGDSSKVNLGLQLIQGNLDKFELDSILKNIELRIDYEVNLVFSNSSSLSINERIKIIDQLQSYFFVNENYNLNRYQEEKIKRAIELHSNFLPQKIDFEINRLKNQHPEIEVVFKEIRILFTQKSYGNLLARAMPYWQLSEPIRMAIIIATLELKRNDPDTFELILSNLNQQAKT